jgi:hypothetical protein
MSFGKGVLEYAQSPEHEPWHELVNHRDLANERQELEIALGGLERSQHSATMTEMRHDDANRAGGRILDTMRDGYDRWCKRQQRRQMIVGSLGMAGVALGVVALGVVASKDPISLPNVIVSFCGLLGSGHGLIYSLRMKVEDQLADEWIPRSWEMVEDNDNCVTVPGCPRWMTRWMP